MNKIENEKTYDSVFWTGVVKMKLFVVPLVNETFDEHFTNNAVVRLYPNKQAVEHCDGSFDQKEMDALVILTEAGVSKPYHFEIETWHDSGIILRIAEYMLASASDHRVKTNRGARVKVPQSAIILLRSDKNAPDSYVLEFDFGDEVKEREVPIIKIQDYSISELFEKKLLLLLPFYGFNFDKKFEQMEQCGIDELKDALDEINAGLVKMVKNGEIDESQHSHLIDWMKRVLDKLTLDYKNVSKGVDDIMGGYILHTRTDDILEQGRKKAHREQIATMLQRGMSPEDIVKFCDYPMELISDVQNSMMATPAK